MMCIITSQQSEYELAVIIEARRFKKETNNGYFWQPLRIIFLQRMLFQLKKLLHLKNLTCEGRCSCTAKIRLYYLSIQSQLHACAKYILIISLSLYWGHAVILHLELLHQSLSYISQHRPSNIKKFYIVVLLRFNCNRR